MIWIKTSVTTCLALVVRIRKIGINNVSIAQISVSRHFSKHFSVTKNSSKNLIVTWVGKLNLYLFMCLFLFCFWITLLSFFYPVHLLFFFLGLDTYKRVFFLFFGLVTYKHVKRKVVYVFLVNFSSKLLIKLKF